MYFLAFWESGTRLLAEQLKLQYSPSPVWIFHLIYKHWSEIIGYTFKFVVPTFNMIVGSWIVGTDFLETFHMRREKLYTTHVSSK